MSTKYVIDVKINFKSNRDILYHPDMHPQTHIPIQINESLSAILSPYRSRFHSQAATLTYFYAGSSFFSSIPFLIDYPNFTAASGFSPCHPINLGAEAFRSMTVISPLSFQPVFTTLPIKAHNFHSDSYTG